MSGDGATGLRRANPAANPNGIAGHSCASGGAGNSPGVHTSSYSATGLQGDADTDGKSGANSISDKRAGTFADGQCHATVYVNGNPGAARSHATSRFADALPSYPHVGSSYAHTGSSYAQTYDCSCHPNTGSSYCHGHPHPAYSHNGSSHAYLQLATAP